LLAREMGRDADAAEVARAYLAQVEARTGYAPVDKEMILLRTLVHAGAVPAAELDARRSRLIDRVARELLPRDRWNAFHLAGLAERTEALAAQAALPELSPENRANLENIGLSSFYLGRLHLLVGEPARAAAILRRATGGCGELAQPLHHNAARVDLGLALEQTGDRDGACAAYAEVLARWGEAQPRSITAERARARTQALACPAR
jgi:eukaryotic-like serine/threonine-protein kinase